MIDMQKFRDEIKLFKRKLSPQLEQQTHLALARIDVRRKIENDAARTKHPIERVLLIAICGELRSPQQQAEFVSRLLLLDLLLEQP